MNDDTSLVWNAPRFVEGPWFSREYFWWFETEDHASAVVCRYTAEDGKPVIIATVHNGPDQLPVATGPLMQATSGGGVNYLAQLAAILDMADRDGTKRGTFYAGFRYHPAKYGPDTYRKCLELADDPDEWAAHFGMRTSPADDESKLAQMAEDVGCRDEDLDRIGVPDNEQGEFQARVVTVWEGAYLAAYETEVKRIAAEKVHTANEQTMIEISGTERVRWVATHKAGELRAALAAKLAENPELVEQLRVVNEADPERLAALVVEAGDELWQWLSDRRSSATGTLQEFTIDSAQVAE